MIRALGVDLAKGEPAAKLLLVDDDTAVRMTLTAVLTKEGYSVSPAAGGREALALIEQTVFDVVVADIRLDDVDGLTVLSSAQERNPDVVTVVLTGYATLESAIDAIRHGVFGYLVKPCQLDEMKAMLESGLERRRTSRANKQVAIAEAVAEARQRAIREFDVEKGTWLAAISHDLKGPLTTIKGTVQWLRRKGHFHDEERLLEAFAQIDLTASRMARMIDELGDIARSDEDHRRLNLEPQNLPALVRRMVDEHQPTTDRHEIVIDCRREELTISCDVPQMERVVGNLLSNAIKYSPAPGTITVTIDCEGGDEGGAAAVLRIADQGLGIPSAELDKVFTRFYRGTNVGSRIPGTGIGLTGSRQILEDHGATISVDSVEGKGSTFTVRFPLANSEVVQAHRR